MTVASGREFAIVARLPAGATDERGVESYEGVDETVSAAVTILRMLSVLALLEKLNRDRLRSLSGEVDRIPGPPLVLAPIPFGDRGPFPSGLVGVGVVASSRGG